MKKYCSNPICNNEIEGMGNNPQPLLNLKVADSVCDRCNEEFVIPARLGEPVSEFIKLMILACKKDWVLLPTHHVGQLLISFQQIALLQKYWT